MDIRPPTTPGRNSSCGPRASCCTKLCSACKGQNTGCAKVCTGCGCKCGIHLVSDCSYGRFWRSKLVNDVRERDLQVSHLQQAQHTNWTELLYCCQTGARFLPRMHAQLHQRIPQACRRNSSSGSEIWCPPLRCLPLQSTSNTSRRSQVSELGSRLTGGLQPADSQAVNTCHTTPC